jgi:hypothetical protein
MQAKDIPERPILEFLRDNTHEFKWATWFKNTGGGMPSVRDVVGPDVPDKVLLAKMAALIKRGLVDGCDCGCRGDYWLTPKGHAALGPAPPRPVYPH